MDAGRKVVEVNDQDAAEDARNGKMMFVKEKKQNQSVERKTTKETRKRRRRRRRKGT